MRLSACSNKIDPAEKKKKTNKHTLLLRRFFPWLLSSKLLSFVWCYWERAMRPLLLRRYFFFSFHFNFPPTNSLIRALRHRIYRFHFVSHMSKFPGAHTECTWFGGNTISSTFSMTTWLSIDLMDFIQLAWNSFEYWIHTARGSASH